MDNPYRQGVCNHRDHYELRVECEDKSISSQHPVALQQVIALCLVAVHPLMTLCHVALSAKHTS